MRNGEPVNGMATADEGGEADVIVVGAGPGGSSTAANPARRGIHVVMLEKSHFSREKVCGDGLTPRATRALTRLGSDTSEEDGWPRHRPREAHRGSPHHGSAHHVWATAQDADEVRDEIAGEPDRREGRGCHGQNHQSPVHRPGGLSSAT